MKEPIGEGLLVMKTNRKEGGKKGECKCSQVYEQER